MIPNENVDATDPVAVGLGFAPGANRVKADVEEIGFCTMRKTELGHGAYAASTQVELVKDARENIAIGNAADVALIDGDPQRGNLSLVLLFLSLQSPQRSANNFTGILVAPALDLLQHKVIKLIGQIDVTGWHGGVPFLRLRRLPRLAKIAKDRPVEKKGS